MNAKETQAFLHDCIKAYGGEIKMGALAKLFGHATLTRPGRQIKILSTTGTINTVPNCLKDC